MLWDKYARESKKAERGKKKNLLSILQIPMTVWKTGLEKQAFSITVLPLGRPSLSGLCWGMNSRRASAWIPYFSRVQAVRSSHRCFCSHHSAWSDQSRCISIKQEENTWINYRHLCLAILISQHFGTEYSQADYMWTNISAVFILCIIVFICFFPFS